MIKGKYVVYSPLGGEVHGEFRYYNASERAEAERKAKACRLAVKASEYSNRVGVAHRKVTP